MALSGSPIKKIGISIDGQEVASATLGVSRPDLVKPYAEYSGHPFNGYSTSVDVTRLQRGLHIVSASAVLQDGSTRAVGRRTFVIPQQRLVNIKREICLSRTWPSISVASVDPNIFAG